MAANLTVPSTTHPWLVDEIDRAALQQTESLFRAHHAWRLADAKERLPASAARVLSALPLLLHTNHPALPGFCGYDIPHGISDYAPGSECLHAARHFANGYSYRPLDAVEPVIGALYFMGSAGSVAHTRNSDLDIWVCLPSEMHSAMDKKLTALTRWAAALGVELQGFAVDPAQFTGGTTLAFSPLLLDEFYRTACLVAGQYPLWWLIPASDPQLHEQIAGRLIAQKYVRPGTFLDFGPVSSFTAEELCAAAVRELERSMQTPHKSLLKLALLESYHAGFAPLSERYKATVANQTPARAIDGYLMLIDHLEAYFAEHPEFEQRRKYMRRAWLTKTSRGNARLWKNPAWWERAHAWGYDAAEVDKLRWPDKSPLTEIISEHHKIIAEYAHALSFLNKLVRDNSDRGTSRGEWGALKEKLNRLRTLIFADTQYNDKLLHAIVPKHHDGNARVERGGDDAWRLLENDQVLIQRARLAQVFAWLRRQGLRLDTLTRPQATSERFRQIFAALAHTPCVALINAEVLTITPAEMRGDALITSDNDPLSYGRGRLSLVRQIDFVHTSPSDPPVAKHWTRFEDALCHLLDYPDVAIVCIGDVRRESIQQRLRALLAEAAGCLAAPDSVYIFQSGTQLCCVQRTGQNNLRATNHATALDCFRDAPVATQVIISSRGRLSREHRWLLSQRVFDAPVLLISVKPGQTRLDYRDAEASVSLHPPPRREADFLQSLSLFTALLKKRGVTTPKLLQQQQSGGIAPVICNAIDEHLRYRLIFRQTAHTWSVQCGQELKTHKKVDSKLIRMLRRQILAHRSSGETYPIYLTDVELPGQDFLLHLRAKIALETALNADTPAELRSALEMFRDPI